MTRVTKGPVKPRAPKKGSTKAVPIVEASEPPAKKRKAVARASAPVKTTPSTTGGKHLKASTVPAINEGERAIEDSEEMVWESGAPSPDVPVAQTGSSLQAGPLPAPSVTPALQGGWVPRIPVVDALEQLHGLMQQNPFLQGVLDPITENLKRAERDARP